MNQNQRILFVCSRNQWRSPTAERVFEKRVGLDVRSAGTSPKARRRVSEKDIAWADKILVMERKHQRMLVRRFGHRIAQKLAVLDIPDEWQAMDPELILVLEDRVSKHLRLADKQ